MFVVEFLHDKCVVRVHVSFFAANSLTQHRIHEAVVPILYDLYFGCFDVSGLKAHLQKLIHGNLKRRF
jgi:hypothetical protein